MSEYFTIKKVSEFTCLSKTTINRFIKAGDFPAPVSVDDKTKANLWNAQDVYEWINTRQRA